LIEKISVDHSDGSVVTRLYHFGLGVADGRKIVRKFLQLMNTGQITVVVVYVVESRKLILISVFVYMFGLKFFVSLATVHDRVGCLLIQNVGMVHIGCHV
jgi:hypothetical protein